MIPGSERDLADGSHRPLARLTGEPLELDDRLGERKGRIESEVHRRGAGVVSAPVDGDVAVHVAGDRVDDPDPVAGVLQHACLLDVHLDPAGQVVEHVDRLAPAIGPVAGFDGVLPE